MTNHFLAFSLNFPHSSQYFPKNSILCLLLSLTHTIFYHCECWIGATWNIFENYILFVIFFNRFASTINTLEFHYNLEHSWGKNFFIIFTALLTNYQCCNFNSSIWRAQLDCRIGKLAEHWKQSKWTNCIVSFANWQYNTCVKR